MTSPQSEKSLSDTRRAQPNPRVRILAIDYGRKRMGLALSDPLHLTAQPLMILSRTNREDDLRRLRELCRKHEVRQIVVGYPLSIDGSESKMSEEASRFASRIQKNLGIAVELVDERLTSWEAAQTRTARPSTRGNQAGAQRLDDIAAAIILREYLDNRRSRHTSASLTHEES